MQKLPPEAIKIFESVSAPQRLIAHLTLVHDVAYKIVDEITSNWPGLVFDRQAVLIGAATHDIGKAIYNHELSAAGKQHEEAGFQLLLKQGLPEKYARFARTHGELKADLSIEDLLVIFADKIWKGARNEVLELQIAKFISEKCQQEIWNVYMKLDDFASEIAKDADKRLAWQASYPI